VSVTTDGHEIRVSAARMSEGPADAPASGPQPNNATPPSAAPAQAK